MMSSAESRRSGKPAPSQQGVPIAEVARRTGLSKDTLRYYEKAGLIESVDRSASGHRSYAVADLAWLDFLLRLRATGMSISDMQQFARLRKQGDRSVGARLALLRDHQVAVTAHIDSLRDHLRAVTAKIGHYQDLLTQQPGTDSS